MSSLFIPPDWFRVLDKSEIFPEATRPLEIDLGCGDGRFTLTMAKAHPERDFLAVERLKGRVDRTSRRINAAGLTNAKVLRLESAYTVAWLLPTAGVSKLHLLCLDPWPKNRHEKNRLILQEEFLSGLARVLEPGKGEFYLKSDDETYYEAALESLGDRLEFERLEWPDDAFFYPPTDFERLWLTEGRTIHRARWRRKPAPMDHDIS